MELCYYQGNNFGDELNPYILNQLVGEYKSLYPQDLLFFIGTILYDNFIHKADNGDKDRRKIILGTGVRHLKRPPKIDHSWKILFVRGPLSSLSLLKNTSSFITDPAYLIRLTSIFDSLPTKKKYKYSVMPHIFSLNKVNWKMICERHNVNFINPAEQNLEFIVNEIAQSEHLITEAMHGAIVADALRVPWKRFKYFSHHVESDIVSEYKWADWLFSMKLSSITYDFKYNKFIRELDKRYHLPFLTPFRNRFFDGILEDVINGSNYQLSSEKLMHHKIGLMLEKINLLTKNMI